jgi:hypothetical protein
MPRALYIVNSRPSAPEREEEYNDWYDNVHLADICSVPGVVGATRYRLTGDESTAGGLPPYLAVYQFDSDDLQTPLDGIMAGVTEGRFVISDALQTDPPPVIGLYVER